MNPLRQNPWSSLLLLSPFLGACSSTGAVEPKQTNSTELAVEAELLPEPVQPASVTSANEGSLVEAVATSISQENSPLGSAVEATLQDAGVQVSEAVQEALKEEPKDDGKITFDPDVQAILSSDRFKRDFAASFLAVSDVEPPITLNEAEAIQEFQSFIAMDSEEGTLRAMAVLNKERGVDGQGTNAIFDYFQGNMYLGDRDFEAAVPLYETALGKWETYRNAHKNLGICLVQLERFDEALPHFTRVIELGGTDAASYGLLGVCYAGAENNIGAESAYRMAMLLDPTSLELQMGLAQSYFKQERYDDAAAMGAQLIRQYPDNPKYWLLQANAYIGLGKPGKAAENYEMVAALGAGSADSHNNLADIYANEGLYNLAVTNYLLAMEVDEQQDATRSLRASALLAGQGALQETQRLVDGIKDLRGDKLSDTDMVGVLKLEARLAVAFGANGREVEILEQVVELNPLDGEALILLGEQAARTDQPERADFYYQRAESIEDEVIQANAKVRRAQLLVKQGKYAQAITLLERAQDLNERESIANFLDQVKRAAGNG